MAIVPAGAVMSDVCGLVGILLCRLRLTSLESFRVEVLVLVVVAYA